jgi:signal transduction histidine kinase
MKIKIKKIRKISNKIMMWNAVSLTISTFLITLSMFLFLFNAQINEEIKEVNEISEIVIEKLESSNMGKIQLQYDNYRFPDKDDISLLVIENGVRKDLTHDFKDEIMRNNTWKIRTNGFTYYKTILKNNREYIMGRNFHFHEFYKIILAFLAIFLLIIASVCVISYLIAKNVTNPLSNIIAQSKELNNRNIEAKLTKSKDDEIGELVDVINETFSKRENLIKSQKKFSSDISHELKTPISIIKGYLDILKWGKTDEKLLDEGLGNIDIEIKNIEQIINNLFLSSQLEQIRIIKEKIELTSLAQKIKRDYEVIYPEQEMFVISEGDTYIIGDNNLVSEAIRGLVDNGIKYSSNNKIELIIEKRKNNAVMIVRDYGVGIEEQEKEKIFERYYKRDRENQRVPGMGLGLSIIKEIVDLHNAKIELVNRNNGLDVILIFEKEEE